jgi:hypothetical protein
LRTTCNHRNQCPEYMQVADFQDEVGILLTQALKGYQRQASYLIRPPNTGGRSSARPAAEPERWAALPIKATVINKL